MKIVFSNLDKKKNSKSVKSNKDCISLSLVNRHYSSLEARIMVIERYIFRFNQLEELRSKMIKIA